MKRQSATSRKPPDPIFFTDRTVGAKRFPRILRRHGQRVEIHDQHFPQDALDTTWIPEVARRGWVILTEDQDIRYRARERDHIMLYGARVFVLKVTDGTANELAATVLAGINRMRRLLAKHPDAFIAKVYRNGEVRMWLTLAEWEQRPIRP